MEPALTTTEVMKLLSVKDPDTVYALVKAGKLKAARLGRRYRFSPAQVRSFLNGEKPGDVVRIVRPTSERRTLPPPPSMDFLRKAIASQNR